MRGGGRRLSRRSSRQAGWARGSASPPAPLALGAQHWRCSGPRRMRRVPVTGRPVRAAPAANSTHRPQGRKRRIGPAHRRAHRHDLRLGEPSSRRPVCWIASLGAMSVAARPHHRCSCARAFRRDLGCFPYRQQSVNFCPQDRWRAHCRPDFLLKYPSTLPAQPAGNRRPPAHKCARAHRRRVHASARDARQPGKPPRSVAKMVGEDQQRYICSIARKRRCHRTPAPLLH